MRSNYSKGFSVLMGLLLSVLFFSAEAPADEIIYGTIKEVDCLNPLISNLRSTREITDLIFQPLVKYNDAEEFYWEIDIDESPMLREPPEVLGGGSRIDVKLRKNLTWHDGENITADDLLFTINLTRNSKSDPSVRNRYEWIDYIQKIDDCEARIYLKNIVYNPVSLLTEFVVFPKHIFEKKGYDYLTEEDNFVWNPVGNGMYYLQERDESGKIFLNAFEDYLPEKANVDALIRQKFSQADIMVQEFFAGKIDLITETPMNYVKEFKEMKMRNPIQLQYYSPLSIQVIAFNCSNEFLKEVRIRRALTMAVDREHILKTWFNNEGSVISGPYAVNAWCVNPHVPPLRFDLPESKKILDDFTDKIKNGIRVGTNGEKMIFDFLISDENEADSPERIACTVIQQTFEKELGIKLNTKILKKNVWEKKVFEERDYDLAFLGWYFPYGYDVSPIFETAGVQNFMGYSNDQVDRYCSIAKLAEDRATVRKANWKIHEILQADAPCLFLWSLKRQAAYWAKIYNLKIHPFSFFWWIDKWELE